MVERCGEDGDHLRLLSSASASLLSVYRGGWLSCFGEDDARRRGRLPARKPRSAVHPELTFRTSAPRPAARRSDCGSGVKGEDRPQTDVGDVHSWPASGPIHRWAKGLLSTFSRHSERPQSGKLAVSAPTASFGHDANGAYEPRGNSSPTAPAFQSDLAEACVQRCPVTTLSIKPCPTGMRAISAWPDEAPTLMMTPYPGDRPAC
jgi:hypothetical protein